MSIFKGYKVGDDVSDLVTHLIIIVFFFSYYRGRISHSGSVKIAVLMCIYTMLYCALFIYQQVVSILLFFLFSSYNFWNKVKKILTCFVVMFHHLSWQVSLYWHNSAAWHDLQISLGQEKGMSQLPTRIAFKNRISSH